MRHLFFISLLLFFAKPLLAQDILMEWPSEELLMEELIVELESRYNLLFSYRQEDIQGVKVIRPKKTLPLRPFLETVLQTSELTYELVDDRFVLLSKRIETEKVPPTIQENKGIKLCGIVIDSLVGDPLMAANIYHSNSLRGTTSHPDGSFILEIPAKSASDTIIVSYVGYQEEYLPVSRFKGGGCPEIPLSYYSFDENFLIVKEYLTDGILNGDNGTFTQLRPESMGALPGQLEPDVLNTIQFLPGVSSLDGSPAGIGVQGGTPDQNLILWEGIPIYHTGHYFGSLTAINPYLIDKVSVYTGGFGASYGGRVSGVVELESEVNPGRGNTLSVGTNLIQGFMDGQLVSKDEKLSMLYSLRHSTIGLWRSPHFRNISKRVQQGILVQNVDLNRLPDGIRINDDLSFFDTNIKLNYQLSSRDEISVAAFLASNDFENIITDEKREQTQVDTFMLQANGIHFNWKHEWSDRLKTNLSALHTDYGYDYTYQVFDNEQEAPNKLGRKESNIQERQLHLVTDYQTNRQHLLTMGYQLVNYDVDFFVAKDQLEDRSGQRDFLSNLHVLYAKIKTNPTNSVGAEIGLRFNHFEQISQQYLEPRVRVWYNFNDEINTYLSGGKYYQYLSQLIQFKGDHASIETPVWGLAGSDNVPVLDANHLQWGIVFRPNTWLIDIQAYLKTVEGLSSLASDFDENFTNRFHVGSANIQGLSLLLKKRWKNYKSWLSYAWTNIDHEFPTFFDEEFTASIEQRHRLRWAHMLTYGAFEFSLGWNISSGRPYSDRFNFRVQPTLGSMGDREIVVPLEDEYNSLRLPAEHQLDASVVYNIQSTNPRGTNGLIGLSLFNIYHQRNVYNRELFIDDRPNMPPGLGYNNKVNMGFTPGFLLRLNW